MVCYVLHRWKLIGKDGSEFLYQCKLCMKIKRTKKKGQ